MSGAYGSYHGSSKGAKRSLLPRYLGGGLFRSLFESAKSELRQECHFSCNEAIHIHLLLFSRRQGMWWHSAYTNIATSYITSLPGLDIANL